MISEGHGKGAESRDLANLLGGAKRVAGMAAEPAADKPGEDERREAGGEESRDEGKQTERGPDEHALQQLVSDEATQCGGNERDRYDRLLVTCRNKAGNINARMKPGAPPRFPVSPCRQAFHRFSQRRLPF